MTRQEALAYIHEWLKDEYSLNSKDREALDMAIKALEQEPTYYPPCIDCNKKMDEIRLAYDKLKEQEPKTGQWVYKNGIRYCEFCGASNNTAYASYCPNCGSVMKGEIE